MGLLDDLLSGIGGQTSGASQVGTGASRQAGGNMSQLMISLLPLVLSMLSQNRAATRSSANPSSGGLGDLLGSLLGGSTSGAGGGLGDLLQQFQKAGLGAEADSWVGRGQNQPLPADGVERVFGRDALSQLARQLGVSEAETSRGLAQLLPEVVDRVTPDGRVPDHDALTSNLDGLARRLGSPSRR